MVFALVLIFAFIGAPFLARRLGERAGQAIVAGLNNP
jgi:hypothetical protein